MLRGTPDFFAITKRLHNSLHGHPGDGGLLGEREAHFTSPGCDGTWTRSGSGYAPGTALCSTTRRPPAWPKGSCRRAPWSCGAVTSAATRRIHIRTGMAIFASISRAHPCLCVLPHCIRSRLGADRSADGDRPLDRSVLAEERGPRHTGDRRHIAEIGLIVAEPGASAFSAESRGRLGVAVRAHRDVFIEGEPVAANARLVVQVSRWDRLKDMAGVLVGFAEIKPPDDVHLMLVGPDIAGVTDDPEGAGGPPGLPIQLASAAEGRAVSHPPGVSADG